MLLEIKSNSGSGSGLLSNFDFDQGPKKRRILPESTPDLWPPLMQTELYSDVRTAFLVFKRTVARHTNAVKRETPADFAQAR